MPKASSLHRHIDRLMGGNLDTELLRLRDEGHNPERITIELARDHNIIVSRGTVRNWLRNLDGPDAA